MIVVDAADSVFGRVAAFVAKQALNGEEVVVINVERSILSGNPKAHLREMAWRRSFKNKADPDRSPKWPRRPDLLFKRKLRGMLPWKKARGKQAFKRIKAYIGDPLGLGEKAMKIEGARKSFPKAISLGDLCRHFGWKG